MTREMIRRPVTVDPAGLRRRMVDAVIGEEVLRRWRVAFTPWRASLLTVPRHRFLPATVWVDNDADPPPALVPLHREQDPDRWLELAYAADHRSGAAHRQVTGYHVRMTAAAASGPQPGAGSPPFADASPAQVRAALIPEDVAEFDRQWRTVMAKATETLDLVD
ncbi:MAG: DUF6247 family protein, partial [Pseudonocardiaceae bacterium]